MRILIMVNTQYMLYMLFDATLSTNKAFYGRITVGPHGV